MSLCLYVSSIEALVVRILLLLQVWHFGLFVSYFVLNVNIGVFYRKKQCVNNTLVCIKVSNLS